MNELSLSVYDNVVEFQRGIENKTRLIFVHPGDWGAESYNRFSKLLNKDIPFYAIDNYNLKHINNMMRSLKDIAKKYIAYLNDKDLIEDNNFVLGGWSSGGVIAFEIAYQLEKMNKKPKKLLIFDSKIKNDFNNEKVNNENNEEIKEYYIKRLEEFGIKENDEFFEEMIDLALKNILNLRKIMDEYLPNNINVDTVYYHANIDDNLELVDKNNYTINKENLNGFRKYIKCVEEVQLNVSHIKMFEDITSLKFIVDSIEKMDANGW
jgi:thioesterase domain-containing protein